MRTGTASRSCSIEEPISCESCAAFAHSIDQGERALERARLGPFRVETLGARRECRARATLGFGALHDFAKRSTAHRYARLAIEHVVTEMEEGAGWHIVLETPEGLATLLLVPGKSPAAM